MSDTRRRPVGVASYKDGEFPARIVIALCDDGSYWQNAGGRWQELEPIPGSPRDFELKRFQRGDP